jgi:hypothetical protein
MLRVDLDAAGVPVEVDGPEGTETRDFHALRAVYISNVIRAGADVKQATTLARHSDPRLTTSRYARTRLHDLGAVVDKPPEPLTPTTEPAVLRLTGTDSSGPVREQPGAATGGGGRLRLRAVEDVSPLVAMGWLRLVGPASRAGLFCCAARLAAPTGTYQHPATPYREPLERMDRPSLRNLEISGDWG